jgi:hypothetical protein
MQIMFLVIYKFHKACASSYRIKCRLSFLSYTSFIKLVLCHMATVDDEVSTFHYKNNEKQKKKKNADYVSCRVQVS